MKAETFIYDHQDEIFSIPASAVVLPFCFCWLLSHDTVVPLGSHLTLYFPGATKNDKDITTLGLANTLKIFQRIEQTTAIRANYNDSLFHNQEIKYVYYNNLSKLHKFVII